MAHGTVVGVLTAARLNELTFGLLALAGSVAITSSYLSDPS